MKGVQVQELTGKQAEQAMQDHFANLPNWELVPIEQDKVTEWAKRTAPKREDLWQHVGKR